MNLQKIKKLQTLLLRLTVFAFFGALVLGQVMRDENIVWFVVRGVGLILAVCWVYYFYEKKKLGPVAVSDPELQKSGYYGKWALIVICGAVLAFILLIFTIATQIDWRF